MRARNLKPSIFKNEYLAKLAPDSYRAFTGLWCLADRKGRLEDRPDRIEAEIFPFKFQKIDMEKTLEDLRTAEDPFIIRYAVNEKRYIQIINFEKHQYPHVREPESTIPAPDQHSESTRPARLNPESPILNPDTEMCRAPSTPRFKPPTPEEVAAFCKERYPNVNAEAWFAHYTANGWKVGRNPMKNWKAAVVTWAHNGFQTKAPEEKYDYRKRIPKVHDIPKK
jgi:hypothetical protein